MKATGSAERASRTKAMIRVAQPKPSLGVSSLKRMGKMMPASGEPVLAMPITRARRVLKYWERMAVDGRKVRPLGH